MFPSGAAGAPSREGAAGLRRPIPDPGPSVTARTAGTVPVQVPAGPEPLPAKAYRPSIRFAMILCWISFEPAKIETLRLLK